MQIKLFEENGTVVRERFFLCKYQEFEEGSVMQLFHGADKSRGTLAQRLFMLDY